MWRDWSDGIASNLKRPAFARAWSRIQDRSTSFAELKRLELAEFKDDPREWIPRLKRVIQWLSV